MKSKFLSFLVAAMALCGVSMSACDDSGGASSSSILTSLAAADPTLAPLAAFSQYGGVAPTPVEITLGGDLAGAAARGTEDTGTWQAVVMSFSVTGITYNVVLFYRGVEVIYIVALGDTELPATFSLDNDDPDAYLVYIPDITVLNTLEEGDDIYDLDGGIFFNDGTDTNSLDVGTLTEGDETELTTCETSSAAITIGPGEIDSIDLTTTVDEQDGDAGTGTIEITDQGPVNAINVDVAVCL